MLGVHEVQVRKYDGIYIHACTPDLYLEPGEKLENGIQPVYVLEEDEGLILKASEAFTDNATAQPKTRTPGDRYCDVTTSSTMTSLPLLL